MKEDIKKQREAGWERYQKERLAAIRERQKLHQVQMAILLQNPSLLEDR